MFKAYVFLGALLFCLTITISVQSVIFVDETLSRGLRCRSKDGSVGVCSPDCIDGMQPMPKLEVCGFERAVLLVCCINGSNPVLYPTIKQVCKEQINILKAQKNRKEEKERQEERNYEKSVQKWLEEKRRCAETATPPDPCGSDFPVRIDPFSPIHKVDFGEHKHMVALGWKLKDDSIIWDCGGSLIHPRFILTAAHCMENKGRPPDVVYIGGVDLTGDYPIILQKRIEKIFVHPGYSSSQNYNDIAILQVEELLDSNGKRASRIACLWTGESLPHEKLLAMGFGASLFGLTNNNRLYQGNLTVLNAEQCNKYYRRTNEMPDGIIDSQICAYDPANILDSCQGDSGGPLQFDEYDAFKVSYLVGIISLGPPCLSGIPGAYTRIYPFLNWIEEILSQN